MPTTSGNDKPSCSAQVPTYHHLFFDIYGTRGTRAKIGGTRNSTRAGGHGTRGTRARGRGTRAKR